MSESFEESKQDSLPSAEDLDAIAAEQAIVEATVTNVNISFGPCTTCGETASRICIHCGQEFCSRHFCLTHELDSERVPLTDEDGTEHQGERIRLIGEGWPNNISFIKDLSDDELAARIAGLKKRLKECIRDTDYTRISLAAHEFDEDYRKHSRYVAAMKRREKLQQGSVRLNNKKHRMDVSGAKVTIPADIAALMKLGNLSYEKAVEMKALLKLGAKS